MKQMFVLVLLAVTGQLAMANSPQTGSSTKQEGVVFIPDTKQPESCVFFFVGTT